MTTLINKNEFNQFGFLSNLQSIFEPIKNTESWIAGGALTSVASGVRINDVDIFSNDFTRVYNKLNKELDAFKTFENDFVANFTHNKIKYQVIKKYKYENVKDTIDSFDFTLCKAGYDGENFECNARFFADLATKRIVIDDKLVKPLSSMKRAFKYVSRGFLLCPVNMLKLTKAVNALNIDWNNPNENEISFYPDGTATFQGID